MIELSEKAKSRAQQRLMGAVLNAKRTGEASTPEVAKLALTMKTSDVKDFASTKHKNLPEKKKKKEEVSEGSEHTEWSASIMLPSKRRKFVTVSCPSRDRKDAIQIIKALYGTDDIKQLNRIGIRTEGVALGKTRSTDTNPKGWKARVSSGKGMTLTKAGGLGKSKPENMDTIIANYKTQVKSDRRAAAKERRIAEGAIDIVRKFYGKKKPKKHVYPPGASGGDAGEKAAAVVRDKEHKKYVNFLPADK